MAKLKAPFALDRSLNTTEQTSRNIADVLAEELSAIITALGGLNFINYEVVEELPTTEISTTTIYLVPSDDPQSGNTYDEYINLNGTSAGWEKIGSTAIDLSGYYTSAETDALLDEKVDKDSFDEQTATDEFTTINGGLLSECKVALSPIQDLHGYLEPWVGGAGKNKLPLPIAETKNDVTLTRNADGSITLSGNNRSGATYFDFFAGDFDSTTYAGYVFRADSTFTAFGTTSISFRISPNDRTSLQELGGNNDYTINNNGSGLYFAVRVASNYSIPTGGVTIYPMLRSSADTSDFEPYSNICPITGHTQVEVGDDGKNRCNESGFEVGTFNINSSVGSTYTNMKQSQSARGRSQGIIDTGNIQMTISCDSNYSVYLAFFDSDGLYTGSNYGWTNSYTFTSPYIAVMLKRNDGANIQSSDFENVHIQIEKGSTATPYVPYNGYQVTVNLAGTYYSGTLDVVSGVFTVDRVGKDMTTITDWNINTSAQRIYKVLSDIKPTSSGTEIPNLISNRFKALSVNDIYSYVQGVAVSTGSALQFHINGLTDRNDVTLAEVNQWFVDNPTLVVYELATPTPIQLSPTMVKALIGENHLYAPLEGQEITEVKYKKMFTFDDVIAYIQSLS